MNMLQTIQAGAVETRAAQKTKCCPFCGEAPPLATRIAGKFVVACENDDCSAQPQVSAPTLSEVWKRWNTRSAG